MVIDARVTKVEIEYQYAEGQGRVVRTLKAFVEGELSSELARELKGKVVAYFESANEMFDHIAIVGAAPDWPADKQLVKENTKRFLEGFPGNVDDN